MSTKKPRSNWWFLFPIFFGIIGGIIAFFVIRNDDPKKGKNCLHLGIILMVIGIVLNIIFASSISEIQEGFKVNV